MHIFTSLIKSDYQIRATKFLEEKVVKLLFYFCKAASIHFLHAIIITGAYSADCTKLTQLPILRGHEDRNGERPRLMQDSVRWQTFFRYFQLHLELILATFRGVLGVF